MDYSDQEYDGVLAGILDKGERERIYIGIRTYMESTFIDLRVYYQSGDDWKPTKRGVTLPVTSFKDLYDTVVGLGTQLGFAMPTPSAGTDESQTAQEPPTATPQAKGDGSVYEQLSLRYIANQPGEQIDTLIDRAKKRMESADYTKALNDLTTALYLNPQNGYIYDLLGSVYEKLGDSAAAGEHFVKAIYWNDRTTEQAND